MAGIYVHHFEGFIKIVATGVLTVAHVGRMPRPTSSSSPSRKQARRQRALAAFASQAPGRWAVGLGARFGPKLFFNIQLKLLVHGSKKEVSVVGKTRVPG